MQSLTFCCEAYLWNLLPTQKNTLLPLSGAPLSESSPSSSSAGFRFQLLSIPCENFAPMSLPDCLEFQTTSTTLTCFFKVPSTALSDDTTFMWHVVSLVTDCYSYINTFEDTTFQFCDRGKNLLSLKRSPVLKDARLTYHDGFSSAAGNRTRLCCSIS